MEFASCRLQRTGKTRSRGDLARLCGPLSDHRGPSRSPRAIGRQPLLLASQHPEPTAAPAPQRPDLSAHRSFAPPQPPSQAAPQANPATGLLSLRESIGLKGRRRPRGPTAWRLAFLLHSQLAARFVSAAASRLASRTFTSTSPPCPGGPFCHTGRFGPRASSDFGGFPAFACPITQRKASVPIDRCSMSAADLESIVGMQPTPAVRFAMHRSTPSDHFIPTRSRGIG